MCLCAPHEANLLHGNVEKITDSLHIKMFSNAC